MERLPDEQREVVALILIEGFGYRETAEMLDIPMARSRAGWCAAEAH
jgi:RNA polymerase sigma-70 factor (ECF subfamily)